VKPCFIFLNRYFHPDHSATSQILSDLAFYLAQRGYTVRIITSCQRYDDPAARLPPCEHFDNLHIHRVWTSTFGRSRLVGRAFDYLSFYFSASWRLSRLVRRGDVVIAKTDPPLIAVPALWITRWRGAKGINWLQDVFPEVAMALGMGGRGMGVLQTFRNWTLRKAVLNIVIGERMAAYLRHLGITRVRVIPNWADSRAITPLLNERNPLRQEWGLTDRFVVGYSGNLGRAHEFDTVLAAMKQRPDCVFLFIGGGHQYRALQDTVAEQGLENAVFKPYQPRERLQQSLAVADVHWVSLLPELEGYIVPSKFYAIAAAGRPVIFIGDCDGELARIIQRADCGRAINVGDGAELARILREYRDDPALKAQHGTNARQLLQTQYDKAIALQAWESALLDVANVG